MNKTLALVVPVPSIDDHHGNNKNKSISSKPKGTLVVRGGGKSIQNKAKSLPEIEGSLNLSVYSTSTISPWIERAQSPKSKHNHNKKADRHYRSNSSDVISMATSLSPSPSRESSPSMKLRPLRVDVEKNFLTITPKPLSPKSKEKLHNGSPPSSRPRPSLDLDSSSNVLFEDDLKETYREKLSTETTSLPRATIINLTSSLSLDDCKDIDRRGFRGSALSISRPIEANREAPSFNPNESTGTLHTMYEERPEEATKSVSFTEERGDFKDGNSIGSSNCADSVSMKSRKSDKEVASLLTETGIQRLTLHSRSLSQYTNDKLSFYESIIPPYVITDIDKPPPNNNWYEAQTAAYIVQNRLVGWKLTQRPRRRELVNLFEMMEEVSPGTYTAGAQLTKLRRVAKSTLRDKFTSCAEVPASLEDFINSTDSMESTSLTTMEMKRREADAWRKTVTRLIRARDSTPAGIAARLKNEKEEKEKNKMKGKGGDGVESERKSTAKLLCASDRLDILELARKQELQSRERERGREALSRERASTPFIRLLTPSVVRASNSLYGGFENDERMKDEDDDGLELYIRELYSRGTSRGAPDSRGPSRGGQTSQDFQEFTDHI